jgi:hypothetical protein
VLPPVVLQLQPPLTVLLLQQHWLPLKLLLVLLPQPLRTLVLLQVLQICCAQAGALHEHLP